MLTVRSSNASTQGCSERQLITKYSVFIIRGNSKGTSFCTDQWCLLVPHSKEIGNIAGFLHLEELLGSTTDSSTEKSHLTQKRGRSFIHRVAICCMLVFLGLFSLPHSLDLQTPGLRILGMWRAGINSREVRDYLCNLPFFL